MSRAKIMSQIFRQKHQSHDFCHNKFLIFPLIDHTTVLIFPLVALHLILIFPSVISCLTIHSFFPLTLLSMMFSIFH